MRRAEGFALVVPMEAGGARTVSWADTNDGIDRDCVAAVDFRD